MKFLDELNQQIFDSFHVGDDCSSPNYWEMTEGHRDISIHTKSIMAYGATFALRELLKCGLTIDLTEEEGFVRISLGPFSFEKISVEGFREIIASEDSYEILNFSEMQEGRAVGGF